MVSEPIYLNRVSPFFLAVATLCMVLMSPPASADNQPSFQVWLANVRAEGLVKGISQTTLDEALTGIALLPEVIELDRNQPEFTLTLEEYLNRIATERRVLTGRDMLTAKKVLLGELYHRYGVQPRFLVALWGIESDFGRLSGGFPVIDALASLAYDGRRSTFFRRELFQALRILHEGHISVDEMTGSWAGAMGQLQFMPSTFLDFAMDFDGDGRIDIWKNLGDAFASAANYLSRSGWVRNQTWGREVQLPKNLNRAVVDLKVRRRLTEWQALGVHRANSQALPRKPNLFASLIEPDGPEGRAFLVYNNYRVILEWNRSHFFGVAVGTLADRIVER